MAKINYWSFNGQTPDQMGGGLTIWFNQYNWAKIYINSTPGFNVQWDQAGTIGMLNNAGPLSMQQWYWIKIVANSSDVSFYFSGDGQSWTLADTTSRAPAWTVDSSSLIILGSGYEENAGSYPNPDLDNSMSGVGPSNVYYYDDARVRKYTTPEPSVLSMGMQETASNKAVYVSNIVNTGTIINVTPVINKYEPNPNVNLAVEVSANGGASWIPVVSGTTYSSGGGVGSGTQLVFRVNFSTNDVTNSATLYNLTLNYWAAVTVSLTTCTGYNYNDMLSKESYGFSKKLLGINDLDDMHLTFDTLFFGITNTGNSTYRNGTITFNGIPHTVGIRNTSLYFDEAMGTGGMWSNKSILIGTDIYDISKIDYNGDFIILRNRIIDCGPNVPAQLSSAVVRRYGVYNGSFAVAELTYW
ncbi:Uncharacterised protein [uncultured archaeon]|nr:Uncharacterised protein [uncultured archaeon]